MAQEMLEQLLMNRQQQDPMNALGKAEGMRPMGRTGIMTPEQEQGAVDLVSGMGMGSLGGASKLGGVLEKILRRMGMRKPAMTNPAPAAPMGQALDSRISGLPPTPPTPAPPVDQNAKLMQIMAERARMRSQGNPMPRVPRKEPQPSARDPFRFRSGYE